MAYNLSRAAGVLAGRKLGKARTATIRSTLINIPARLAFSAGTYTLHLGERDFSGEAGREHRVDPAWSVDTPTRRQIDHPKCVRLGRSSHLIDTPNRKVIDLNLTRGRRTTWRVSGSGTRQQPRPEPGPSTRRWADDAGLQHRRSSTPSLRSGSAGLECRPHPRNRSLSARAALLIASRRPPTPECQKSRHAGR